MGDKQVEFSIDSGAQTVDAFTSIQELLVNTHGKIHYLSKHPTFTSASNHKMKIKAAFSAPVET
jgi:hypothetical protein